MRPNAHRAHARLHVRHYFALEQHDVAGHQRQHGHDHQRVNHWHDKRPDIVKSYAKHR